MSKLLCNVLKISDVLKISWLRAWCALIQLHNCACKMCIISSFAIHWQFRRFDHNGSHKPVSVLPPSNCTYNNHITKNGMFLAYFMRILNTCKFQTVKLWQVSNCQTRCPPSQPHTFSARLLFDETFARPDVFAVVNCPVVALGVLYSAVIMCSLTLRGVV